MFYKCKKEEREVGAGKRRERGEWGREGRKREEPGKGRGEKMGKEKRKKEKGEREETGNYGAGDLTIYIKA